MLMDVNPQEALNIIEENYNNSNFIVLDVRTPAEFNEDHIKGAVLLDYYSANFKDELEKLNKDNFYLIYCRSGVRSKSAMDLMSIMGFKEIYNLLGGIMRWKTMGLPTIIP